jgi:endonuclease/exonuclease/phosphatase family metal-dependent hydrolase
MGGKLGGNINALLKDVRPDILCLQEAASSVMSDPGLFFTTEQMQKSLDIQHAVFEPLFSFRVMQGTVHFGNAILSKSPIVSSHVEFTNLEHVEDFDFNKHDYNIRNFVHCTIDIHGTLTHVITHHGHHVPSHKNGNEETLRQMRIIAEYVKKLQGPVILAGDFNLAPHSESLELVNDVLTNLSIKNKLQTTRTALTRKTEVCDYIFVNELVKVSHFSASDELASDHKALIMEFDV